MPDEINYYEVAATMSRWAREHKHVLAVFDLATNVAQMLADQKEIAHRLETARTAFETERANLGSVITALQVQKEDLENRLIGEERALREKISAQRARDLAEYEIQIMTCRDNLSSAQAALKTATAETRQVEADRVTARMEAADARSEYSGYINRIAKAKQDALASLT